MKFYKAWRWFKLNKSKLKTVVKNGFVIGITAQVMAFAYYMVLAPFGMALAMIAGVFGTFFITPTSE